MARIILLTFNLQLISALVTLRLILTLGTLMTEMCLLISGNVYFFFLLLAMTSCSSLVNTQLPERARVMICIALELFPFSLFSLATLQLWEKDTDRD